MPAEVSDLEQRKAAIHEAAHAVIAHHLGYGATPEIHRTPDPGPDDKLWIGSTDLYGHIVGIDARLIGLAGVIAEEVNACPDVDAEDLLNFLDDGTIELSCTDAQMAGSYTPQDIDDILSLVRGHWPRIDEEAKFLAIDACEPAEAHS